jgi:hypothetical protein
MTKEKSIGEVVLESYINTEINSRDLFIEIKEKDLKESVISAINKKIETDSIVSAPEILSRVQDFKERLSELKTQIEETDFSQDIPEETGIINYLKAKASKILKNKSPKIN